MNAMTPAAQNGQEKVEPIKFGEAFAQASEQGFDPDKDYNTFMLRQQSGNFMVQDGRYHLEEDDDRSPQKAEMRLRQSMAISQAALREQTFSYGGLELGYDVTLQHMSSTIGYNQEFLKANPPREITKDDMLYVDRNGKLVDSDNPDARVVATVEEKKALEDSNGLCTIKSSVEETTMLDGKVVAADDFLYGNHVAQQTEELIQAQADIESGKVKLEDLPENIKEAIVLAEQNKDNPRAEIADTSKMNMLELLDLDAKKREFAATANPNEASPKSAVAMDGPRPPVASFGM